MTLPRGTPAGCPILIGHATTLDTLQDLIERGGRGGGQTILISGEAGIGKSRLVREATKIASASGFLVLKGHCFQHERAWPYTPLLDCLRTYFATLSQAELAANPTIREVVRLLPELLPYTPAITSEVALEPAHEKRRLFMALVALLQQLAARQPLLLIVEDLHWSDEGSLDFLLYLARRVTDASLVLLLTYRDDEPGPGLPWLAELDRTSPALEISLSRLQRSDVHEMVRAIFSLQRLVRVEFLDAIYALTDGNPFFVEEVLSTLVAAGEIFYVDGEWDRKPLVDLHIPRSVQAAVQQRVDRLSVHAYRLLAVAAVAGRSFDATLLEELTRLAEPALLAALKELVDAHLVVEEGPDRFAFRHTLTRQAIYARLLVRERKAIHRLCAEALASAPAADAMLGDLAYHFNAAEVWPQALDYGRRAAQRALMRYAPRAAVEYLDHALHAAKMLAVPMTELLQMRADAFETLGDFEQARADLERALEQARVARDRNVECTTLLELGKLWASRDYREAGIRFEDALDLARKLGDLPMEGRCLNRVGNWHLNREQPDEARRYHHEALAIFQRLEDTRGIAETLDLLGMTNYLGGDLLTGTAHYQRAATLFRELDDRIGLINCLATLPLRGGTYQTNTMVAAASLLAANVEGEEARAMARAIGWRSGEAYAEIFLGFCLGSRGDYAQALDVLHNALVISEEIEHRQWITAARCARGALYLDLLALEHARVELEAALALAVETGSTHWIHCTAGFLAAVYLQQRETKRAEDLLASVLAPAAPAHTLGQRLVWCARADLALAHGDVQTALAIVERLEASAANQPPSGPAPILRLLLLRADVLAALRRPDEAEALLRVALDVAVTQGARPMLWRLHVALGNVFRLQERYDEVETTCASARGLVESLAAAVPEEALRGAFVRRAVALLPPTRTSSGRRATRHPVAPLTARECEVAAEIARGKSNAAIASSLVLSERTVESHIGNILSKLAFTSRRAIAAWATKVGLAHERDQ